MSIITLRDVHKTYLLGKVPIPAVQGVSFRIEKGDFVSIAGPSGSGKSTILNLVGLIDRPTGGQVLVDDRDVAALDDRELTSLRHEAIGFIFQSFNLIPVLTTRENIEFPLLLGKSQGIDAERRDYIDYLIEAVGLADRVRNRPNELSGGQRQRVAIARALVTKPLIVLADEPTANLDSATGDAILRLMRGINQSLGTTFVFSTHDAKVVDLADHIVRLKDGRVTEDLRREVAHASR